ncbi:hypothetical protein JCM17846_29470 [Iodidimonas nitroreducens]|uniref:SsrA-binding protein n=1 Tax=Iodidimonas nitroreducens TaxID=1236968 RepID=A0A5A7NCC5_9PROT|nr:hypothetical protein JCM17846_29470 [Iodidimonas nitroreducens]
MVKQDLNGRMVSENRKARYNYAVEDTYEAGIALKGTEVKALRKGTANIAESYAEEKNGEIWLINAHIDEFSHGNIHNHEPRRPRKLLLHRKEINKIAGAIQRAGMTLVPLKIYFNDRGGRKFCWVWRGVKKPMTSARISSSVIGIARNKGF